jgi:hypothetical protein
MTVYNKKPTGNSYSIDKGFYAVERHFWVTTFCKYKGKGENQRLRRRKART